MQHPPWFGSSLLLSAWVQSLPAFTVGLAAQQLQYMEWTAHGMDSKDESYGVVVPDMLVVWQSTPNFSCLELQLDNQLPQMHIVPSHAECMT